MGRGVSVIRRAWAAVGLAALLAVVGGLFVSPLPAQAGEGGPWEEASYPLGANAGLVAVDPQNPAHLWAYYGVLDGLTGLWYRSTDYGHTWSGLSTGLQRGCGIAVTDAVADPANSSTHHLAAACTSRDSLDGLYLSADSGLTWRRALAGEWVNARFAPANPQVIYATITSSGSAPRLVRSTDGGQQWQDAGRGLPGTASYSYSDLAVHPSDSNTLYVLVDGYQLWQSTDGGANWHQQANRGLPNAAGLDTPCLDSLVIDPSAPGTLFALGASDGAQCYFSAAKTLYRSTNQGASWSGVKSASSAAHDVAPVPGHAGQFFLMTGDGLFRSTDHGASWSRVSDPTAFADTLGHLVVDDADPQTLYSDALDFNGVLYISHDGGVTWGDYHERPNTALARPGGGLYSGGWGVFSSADGVTWAHVDGALPADGNRTLLHSIAVVAGSPPRLFAGLELQGTSGKLVWRSDDNGLHWQAASNGLPAIETDVAGYDATVLADPAQSNRLYTILASPAVTGSTSLVWAAYQTSDSGDNWTQVWSSNGRYVDDAARTSKALLLATSHGLVERIDGQDWITATLPLAGHTQDEIDVAYVAARGDQAVATTYSFSEAGHIFYSADGGVSWQESAAPTGDVPGSLDLMQIVPGSDAWYLFWRQHGAGNYPPSGTLRSTDGGASWQAWATPYCSRVLASLGGDRVLISQSGVGMLGSDNAGGRWDTRYAGLAATGQLAAMAAYSDTVWAATMPGIIFKSTDRGSTWQLNVFEQATSHPDLWCTASVNVQVNPADPQRVYLGGGSNLSASGFLYVSTDGGDQWQRRLVGPSVLQVALSPTAPDGIWVAGREMGLYYSPDVGASWQRLFDGNPVYGVGVKPSNPSVLAVGTNYQPCVYYSDDGGARWSGGIVDGTALSCGGYDGPHVAYDAAHPGTVYLAPSTVYSKGSHISTDDGYSWTQAASAFNWPDGYGPSDPLRVYSLGPHSPARSLDGGVTWKALPAAPQWHSGVSDGFYVVGWAGNAAATPRLYQINCDRGGCGFYRLLDQYVHETDLPVVFH